MARISLGLCLMFLVASSTIYEVQGTFLLRHYLRKLPRRSNDFRPFACKGMLRFVDVLELKCPLKPEYKNFFGKLKSYMSFINSASGSTNFDVELKGQAEGLQSAMSAMGGKSGSVDTSNVMDVLLSMGKTLGESKNIGSTTMTFAQRKELIISMAKWAQTIGQFVVTTASKSGASIDISSLGIDGIDVSADAGSSPTNDGTSSTGTGSSSKTTSGSTTGSSTNTGSSTSGGGSTNTGSSTSVEGSTDTGAEGSVNTGSSTKSSSNSGTQTTNGGVSTCTTSACSSGNGGSSVKGSLTYQQQTGMGSSQETTTGTSN